MIEPGDQAEGNTPRADALIYDARRAPPVEQRCAFREAVGWDQQEEDYPHGVRSLR